MKIKLISLVATIVLLPMIGLADTSPLSLANQSPSTVLQTETMYITPKGSILVIQRSAATQGANSNSQTKNSTTGIIIGQQPLQIGSLVTVNNSNYAVKSIANTSAGEKIVILEPNS